ncbi:hypothetical protein [Subtercola lobariae]|uniref:Uncharacterized protein n=1 Tax=Subtercola lobariae TaxID=1588641 RepID=A0A917EVT6_9MICO|nr:hypothetical protein [Subtercola lobariae]GGF21759.1 hypothetical protein GCM10011399_14350 [Subtercola lobariae]
MSTTDVIELTQLVQHERQARDRGWWQVMRDSYAADSAVRLSWFRGGGQQFVDESADGALDGFREPYRMLAYVLGSRGYTIGDDLYGDDRTDDVSALYAAAFEWLGA